MYTYIRSLAGGVIILLLGISTLVAQEVTYSTGPAVTPKSSTPNQGHAWADIDSNGTLDLFVPSQSILVNTSSAFTILSTVNLPINANVLGSLMADFTGDGLPDLLVTNGSSRPILYQDSAKVNFVDISSTMGDLATVTTGLSGNCWGITAGPIDHTNYLSIAWAGNQNANNGIYSDTGQVRLLKGGPGGFTNVSKGSASPVIDVVKQFESWNPQFVDANGDSYQDLFLPSFRGNFPLSRCILYMNDGSGNFTVPTSASVGRTIYARNGSTNPDTGIVVNDTVCALAAQANVWGDLNNDGNMDLILESPSANNFGVYLVVLYGNGDGTFTNGTAICGITQENSIRAIVIGDYNNDGYPDILTGGSGGPQTRLWRNNNADGTFTNVTTDLPPQTLAMRGIGFVDYNNDGFLDIMGSYGGNTLSLRNGGNSNHWIAFKPIGSGNNMSAVGARFVVYVAGGLQVREITANGCAEGMGGTLWANFGIGTATAVDSVVVIWPDGQVQTYVGLGIDRYWVVKQGAEIPPAPPLVSPANGATGQPTSLTLEWNTVAGAGGNQVTYQVQLSIDPTFESNIIVNDSLLTDSTRAVTSLGNSTWYYWRVRALEVGFFGAWATDSFQTIMQVPTQLTLISPVSDAVDQSATLTLIVSKSDGAAQYHWQISTDLAFSSFAINDSTTDTIRVIGPLASGTKYYWQVRGVNPGGGSAFAGPDSFTVMTAPAMPMLVYPASDQKSIRADTLSMMWASVAAASGYECQLSLNSSMSPLIVTQDSTADTTFTVTSLLNLTQYYWRVRAYNIGGASGYTVVDSFTTIVPIPAAPTLSSPASGASGVSRRPTFVWRSTTYSERYRLQVSTNSGYTNVVADTTVADTTVTLSYLLAPSILHYWHVSAIDTNGASPYSSSRIFTTGTTGVNELGGDIPKEFALLQNYPNPFNPSTTIRYDLPKTAYVKITIYDILGRVAANLVDGVQNANRYNIEWNASHLGSGIYFYRIEARSQDGSNNFTSVKKLILMK